MNSIPNASPSRRVALEEQVERVVTVLVLSQVHLAVEQVHRPVWTANVRRDDRHLTDVLCVEHRLCERGSPVARHHYQSEHAAENHRLTQ